MKAVCWQGLRDVRVEDVPEPRILNPRDAIIKVSSTAICGTDLHIYNGLMPSVQRGDVLGHEFMGEVVAVGSAIGNLREGDRVVVPCVIDTASGCSNSSRRESWIPPWSFRTRFRLNRLRRDTEVLCSRQRLHQGHPKAWFAQTFPAPCQLSAEMTSPSSALHRVEQAMHDA